ncbi:MAG: outer membrane beta-barrel protein [Alphaproteobacteria bacterium]|nr:outer membrane beta-barrel protein [Alphaproteobacteria bacterium]
MLTTMLFTPALAAAQTADTPSPPASEEAPADEFPADDAEFGDDGEIVVLGRFIPTPQQQTSEVASFLSAEDLARTGDDNAAAALTRVTGLSVVSGRFVYVRGLGDRYSSALLNGSPLPSPEPLRRQVPLDLFPSNILEGATVQKTFSANYPGEFGGGIIDLRTLRLPSQSFFTVQLGTSGNTETTDQRGPVYYGEGSDWTGYSDGARDLPRLLESARSRGLFVDSSNFTDAELESIGESLTNSPLTVVQTEHYDPNFEGEVTAGSSIDFGRYNIGLVGVLGYDNSYTLREAERVDVVGDAVRRQADVATGVQDVVINAFGSASLSWEGHEFALTGLLVRSTSKEAQISEGVDSNDPGLINRKESTAWYERQLASVQLAGDHEFGPLTIDWRGAFAQSTRDAPYEREVTYFSTDNGASFAYSREGQNQTRFTDLTDEVFSGGIDAAYTIPLSDERDAVISAGYDYANTVRTFEVARYSYLNPSGTVLPDDVQNARVDFLFSPDNIDPQRFVLTEVTNRDDSYKARLTVNSAYVSVAADILPLVSASVGVRYEDASQLVRTTNPFGLTPFSPASLLENQYWLPAVTLTWNFAEDLQARLGYSQTIARPQFRELAASSYIDPDSDRVYSGNPFLSDTEFQNYDARLEYYFGRNQFVTVGGFYKQLENPIEEVITDDGNNTLTRFINAPEAQLYGAEIEYRTNFQMPFELPFLNDADWLFAVNYTYTKSEVIADPGSLIVDPRNNRVRTQTLASQFRLDGSQLQGTPENIANLQFGFETDTDQLTLLVGWVDERIARRGLGSVPSVLERPGTQLDLVYRRNFTVGGTDMTLGLSGRNLLDENYEEVQNSALGETNVNTYDRGMSFSASLSAKF